MSQQHDHRRENAVQNVARDVVADETEERRRDEASHAKRDCREECRSHFVGSGSWTVRQLDSGLFVAIYKCPTVQVTKSSMTDSRQFDPPSPFIEEWAAILGRDRGRPGRAVDVATGRGRHAAVLAAAGFRTFVTDIQRQFVRDAIERAAHHGRTVSGWCADLQVYRLPPTSVDLIVVTRYLQRDLCASLAHALRPGGFVLYETFTDAQLRHGPGPTSPDHLLRPGELPVLFGGLERVFYEEVFAPDALARLAARKRSRPS